MRAWRFTPAPGRAEVLFLFSTRDGADCPTGTSVAQTPGPTWHAYDARAGRAHVTARTPSLTVVQLSLELQFAGDTAWVVERRSWCWPGGGYRGSEVDQRFERAAGTWRRVSSSGMTLFDGIRSRPTAP